MNSVVKVNNISKSYKINQKKDSQEIVSSGVLNRVSNWFNPKLTELFALKDISFDLNHGDVFGVIGKNGAGKSTLLKILSRVVYPTSGEISIYGRVSSLLEVGTGFHDELTGRENVFLNGAILGMSHGEIKKKFDEIVDFSGVGSFLDVPIKRYSSGMRLRLAFSVAAYLDPDVLIIDEILAVGDMEFQKKCLETVGSLGSSGKVVLFVSHDLTAVRRLCNKAMLLSNGEEVKTGNVSDVINFYIGNNSENIKSSYTWDGKGQGLADDVCQILSVDVKDDQLKSKDVFSIHEKIWIEIRYEIKKNGHKLAFRLVFSDNQGRNLFMASDTVNTKWIDTERVVGDGVSKCLIPNDFLNAGTVSIALVVHEIGASWGDGYRIACSSIVSFYVEDDMKLVGARGDWVFEWVDSAVRPVLKWEV